MNNSLIELKDLVIDLDGKRFLNANLKLNPGSVLLIKGRSGTGKSTLLRSVARLHPAESGDIFFEGIKSDKIKPMNWRKKICYLAQTPVMFPGTLLDNLQVPRKFRICEEHSFNKDEAMVMLDRLDIPQSLLHNQAGGFSGGEAARVAVARALLCNPEVILADEITASLDEESAVKMISVLWDWMRNGGRAIMVVVHHINLWKEYISEETVIEDFIRKKDN
jgi:putative ABC transport system ATP-binding protein